MYTYLPTFCSVTFGKQTCPLNGRVPTRLKSKRSSGPPVPGNWRSFFLFKGPKTYFVCMWLKELEGVICGLQFLPLPQTEPFLVKGFKSRTWFFFHMNFSFLLIGMVLPNIRLHLDMFSISCGLFGSAIWETSEDLHQFFFCPIDDWSICWFRPRGLKNFK